MVLPPKIAIVPDRVAARAAFVPKREKRLVGKVGAIKLPLLANPGVTPVTRVSSVPAIRGPPGWR